MQGTVLGQCEARHRVSLIVACSTSYKPGLSKTPMILNLRNFYLMRPAALVFSCFCLSLMGCASKVGHKYNEASGIVEQEWASAPYAEPVPSGGVYNAHNAYTLARACALAWEDDKIAIDRVAGHWKLPYLYTDLRGTHTQYVLIGDSRFTILAFRATQGKLGDLWTVSKFIFYETSVSDSIYHGIPPANAGFRESAAGAIASGLIRDITLFRGATRAENAPLFITGHSLGGAVALLVRPKLEEEGIVADSVYLYGAPITISPNEIPSRSYYDRYGSSTFLHRFVGDNVPRLRGRSLMYEPPGIYLEINSKGEKVPMPRYQSLNGFSSLLWTPWWLMNGTKAHSLQKSYLPALQQVRSAETEGN
jgi:hypothetical protein